MDLEKISSYAILLISIFMIAFQFALALGLPYGKLAWGGKYSKLPKNLRIGSLISAIIFTIAGLISLQELLFITFIKQSTIMKFLLWFYVLLFSLK